MKTSVVSEIVFVEGDRGTVGILKRFFRFKGHSQSFGTDGAYCDLRQEFIEVGVQFPFSVFFFQGKGNFMSIVYQFFSFFQGFAPFKYTFPSAHTGRWI